MLAPSDADAASDYTSDVHMDAGNIVWRALFWIQIWQTVHENGGRALFGYGYGFPLNELVPYLQDDATQQMINVAHVSSTHSACVVLLVRLRRVLIQCMTLFKFKLCMASSTNCCKAHVGVPLNSMIE